MAINDSHVDTRWSQFLRNRARGDVEEAFTEFTLALQAGTIQIPRAAVPGTPVYAGGVNYCPNSDLKYSRRTAEVPGTLPGDAGDDNQECYRFYRQEKDDDITLDAAHQLKAADHSLYAANEGMDSDIPIWDRVNGQLVFGSAGEPLWDVAAQLYNNDVKSSDTWHVRFVLGAMGETLLPDDLEMYCGIWHKTASGEGWITGGNFNLSYEIVGIKGNKKLNYVVVATTDSGNTLYSQILEVTEAPATLDTDTPDDENLVSFVRLSYGEADGAGFVNFKIYREDHGTGRFYQIANIQNTNSFVFDDTGGNVNMYPVAALPAGSEIKTAIAYSRRLDVGAFGAALIINDFTIRVPDDYDDSATLPFRQFLRFGFTRTSGAARAVRLDKIYLGPTFNKWSDSPLDPLRETPSTSRTGGTPSGGGGYDPPPPGSGTCIRFDVPVLRLDFDRRHAALPYREIPFGDVLENGSGEKNLVLAKPSGKNRKYYRLYFSNHSWIYANARHRLPTDEKGGWTTAGNIKTGDAVMGWTRGRVEPVELLFKEMILVKKEEDFGTFALSGEKTEGDHFYVAGFSRDGSTAVLNINRKPDLPDPG
jgi:hypothetical protein